eukprot:Nk52_evm19s243 gene=Nk52_evmTU19s243
MVLVKAEQFLFRNKMLALLYRFPKRRGVLKLVVLALICYFSFHVVFYHILHLGQCNTHHHFMKWSKCSVDRSLINGLSMPSSHSLSKPSFSSDSSSSSSSSLLGQSNFRGDRIALVSVCQGQTDVDQKMCALAMDNHMHYGRFHAYLLRGRYGVPKSVVPYSKISRLKSILNQDPVEWVMYMNYNHYFLDFSIPVSRYISGLSPHTEMVMSKHSEKGVSMGGFILRKSRWSLAFLNQLYDKMSLLQKDEDKAKKYSESDLSRLDEIALKILLKEKPDFFKDKIVYLSECVFIGDSDDQEFEVYQENVHFHGDYAVRFPIPDPKNPYAHSVYFDFFAKKLKDIQNYYILGGQVEPDDAGEKNGDVNVMNGSKAGVEGATGGSSEGQQGTKSN